MPLLRFPAKGSTSGDENLAIGLFGNRFDNGQTVVEYLAELLLVLSSPKEVAGRGKVEAYFPDGELEGYCPPHLLALKLFAFFKTSKLETRHPVHRRAFVSGIELLRGKIESDTVRERDDFLQGLQGLFGGFVGVADNRTWVTQAFLPASPALLAREIMWKHKEAKGAASSASWSELAQSFQINKHNFYARGGEHLYLQLAQLFRRYDDPCLETLRATPGYAHLQDPACALQASLEAGLARLLAPASDELGWLARFVDGALEPQVSAPESFEQQPASFGWVPSTCLPEALMYAWELDNLLGAEMDPLERIEALQLHAVLHVLRTLCFQTMRYIDGLPPLTFVGHYAWIMSPPEGMSPELRHLAEGGFHTLEQHMQQALRRGDWPNRPPTLKKGLEHAWKLADEQAHKLVRKLGKAVGVVIPFKGPGMRFRLTDEAVRMLVPALLPAGHRLSEEEFERRLYLHYGIVIGGDRAAEASRWATPNAPPKLDWPRPRWFADALQAGGFLIPLSDAVSMVRNPYAPVRSPR